MLVFVRGVVGRVARALRRFACHASACHQEFRHNLIGRHDRKPYGVWECVRCGRVRLGRAIPETQEHSTP